jgi:hypothetical protein
MPWWRTYSHAAFVVEQQPVPRSAGVVLIHDSLHACERKMMLELLVVVILALHLMAANVASAGPIVCAWLDWREGRGDATAGQAGRYLAGAGLAALLVTAVLGSVLTALVWDDALRTAFVRLGPRVMNAVGELIFSLVLMLGHWCWWKWRPQAGRIARGIRGLVAILAGTNLLYHFPLLFAMLTKVTAGEFPGEGKIASAAIRQMLVSGDVFSKSVHVWLASFAVTGVLLIGYGMRAERHGMSADDARRVVRWGAILGLVPTFLQLPVGLWLITQLPRPAIRSIMGNDLLSSLLFFLSVGLFFPLSHYLAAAAMRGVERKTLVRIMMLMTLIVLLMSGVLYRGNRVSRGAVPMDLGRAANISP